MCTWEGNIGIVKMTCWNYRMRIMRNMKKSSENSRQMKMAKNPFQVLDLVKINLFTVWMKRSFVRIINFLKNLRLLRNSRRLWKTNENIHVQSHIVRKCFLNIKALEVILPKHIKISKNPKCS